MYIYACIGPHNSNVRHGAHVIFRLFHNDNVTCYSRAKRANEAAYIYMNRECNNHQRQAEADIEDFAARYHIFRFYFIFFYHRFPAVSLHFTLPANNSIEQGAFCGII